MIDTVEDGLLSEDVQPPKDRRFPLARPPAPQSLLTRFWQSPLVLLVLYYVVMIGGATLLIVNFPVVRQALVTPIIPALSEGAALLSDRVPPPSWDTTPALLSATLDRALITFLVVAGAIAIAIPVAWIYMLTKRLRYDPGLVRSVIILPIAVAGILLVVKNSLAIAFSLAGIVAAVRFRNTLKDPRDAVYIFLTIAIGIAAGVQAIDVALVVSLVFNVVVVILWKFQVGSIQGGRYGRTGVLSVGDSSLLVAVSPESCRTVRRKLVGKADDMRTDGILLVHTTDPDLSRQTVQDALSQTTREWRLMGIWPRGEELKTAEYLIRLAKDSTPADVIGVLDEWSTRIDAAEYIPFRQRVRPRPEDGKADKREKKE